MQEVRNLGTLPIKSTPIPKIEAAIENIKNSIVQPLKIEPILTPTQIQAFHDAEKTYYDTLVKNYMQSYKNTEISLMQKPENQDLLGMFGKTCLRFQKKETFHKIGISSFFF